MMHLHVSTAKRQHVHNNRSKMQMDICLYAFIKKAPEKKIECQEIPS